MTEVGSRELKKARTRRAIADAAARLFAERGYEQVAVSDVARAAEVSEQTVYNYFQTKEQLVTDLDRDFQEELDRLMRTRTPGASPAAAIRELVLDAVEGIRRVPADQWRGELGYLAAISPTIHRLSLEMSDRQANTIATPSARPARSHPRSPSYKASHSPAYSRSSSPMQDSAHLTAKPKTRSPASSTRPSMQSCTTSTAGWRPPPTNPSGIYGTDRNPVARTKQPCVRSATSIDPRGQRILLRAEAVA
jgi:AcrR family transcriptional regulator